MHFIRKGGKLAAMTVPQEKIPLIVERFNAKGRPIAHVVKTPGAAPVQIELPYGVPGDCFSVAPGRTRRGKAKAYDLYLDTPSKDRVKPLCSHAEVCGGCPWQAVDYPVQLCFKQERIEKLFVHHIKSGASIFPIIPSVSPWNYRNKMEFSFSQNRDGERFLGLMMLGGKGRVLNLKECPISSAWMIEALQSTSAWWYSSPLAAYHPHRDTGTLRTLTLREGKRTGAKMAILTVSGRAEYAIGRKEIFAWSQTLTGLFPNISCFLRVQQACKGMPTQFYEWHLSGPSCLEEKMILDLGEKSCELRLQISPSSFFQTNTFQAERFYSEALKLLDVSPEEHVIDLYAGTATIGMALSKKVKKVTSIEINPYAVLDAKANIAANAISNLDLVQADAGEALLKLSEKSDFTPPGAFVVDPPRGGLGPKALEPILALKPSKLLYISCNPATQLTDIDELVKGGYRLALLQPVDQFPHTPHVENIALLSLT